MIKWNIRWSLPQNERSQWWSNQDILCITHIDDKTKHVCPLIYSTYGYFIIMVQKKFIYIYIYIYIYTHIYIYIKPYVEVWYKQLLIRDIISWPTPFYIMSWISNESTICSHCCNMGCEYISMYLTHLYSRLAEEYPGIANIGLGSQNGYCSYGSMVPLKPYL